VRGIDRWASPRCSPGVYVRDRETAIDFYTRLLGKPPARLPKDDEAA
jgi:hypothetical protein